MRLLDAIADQKSRLEALDHCDAIRYIHELAREDTPR
jgi:hypothetical protein